MTKLTVLPNGRTVDKYCQECGLWKECASPRMNGEGAAHPKFLFVMEAPGETEDRRGIPACGEAGQLLRETIEQVGINIQECRFTNVVRCRPPNNDLTKWKKAPELCLAHLLREIRSTNPKVVVVIGAVAMKALLDRTGVLKLHGEVFQYPQRTFVTMFHPAYLLRNNTPENRQKFRQAIATVKALGNPKAMKRTQDENKVEIIKDKKRLYEVTDYLRGIKLKATDIESSTLSPYSQATKPEVGIVGFAAGPHMAFIFPIYSRLGTAINFHPRLALEAVAELWEDSDCEYILHGGKHDYTYMAVLHGIWLQGFRRHPTGYSYDTHHESYTLKGEPGGHKLKELAWKLGLGGYEFALEQYKREHPEAKSNYNLIPLPILGPYCGMDCITTFRLHHYFRPILEKRNLWKNPYLFPQMYHNWTAAMLQIKGIKTDLKRNKELSIIVPNLQKKAERELEQFDEVQTLLQMRKDKARKKIRERVYSYKRKVSKPKRLIKQMLRDWVAKHPMKWTPDERRTLVFDVLRYPSLAETKKGLPVVSKKILKKLLLRHGKHTVLEKLMERGLYYYANTKYVKPIPSWVGSDGRTHTTYNPAGQNTGRVPSENPNHENIPKREPKVAPLIRSQFVPTSDDYVFAAGDGKQMELRLVCDASGDETMQAEFEARKDPHKMGASAFYEVPEAQVTKEQRTDAKSAVSFGLIYGRSTKALAADYGKSIEWAQEKINRYFAKYRRIPEWWKSVEEFVKRKGYVLSTFGRRSYCPGIRSSEEGIYKKAVRDAINHPIQGTGSDITWIAAYRMQRWLMKYRLRSKAEFRQQRFVFYRNSRPVVVIHDDVTGDVYLPELEDYIEHLQFYMTDRKYIEEHTGWWCKVPLDLDISLSRHHLGESVELERNGDDFIIPKEFKV